MLTDKIIEWAYLGIRKCPSCENHCDFWIGEYVKYFSLIRIPLITTRRQCVSICGICEDVWQLDSKTQNQLLRESIDVPPHDKVWELWCVLEANLTAEACAHESANASPTVTPTMVTDEIRRMKEIYTPRYVDYVGNRFKIWLRDTSETSFHRHQA